MEKYSYGLKRIILIDSFLPSRTYEVDLSGNAVITGTNGLGKTSLIKLPVIFYGANPSEINIKENKETKYKGFSGRYLPRDGSYVVFEYLANEEKKCVVFLPEAKSEEGICRYFIDTGYSQELFFEDAGTTPRSRNSFLQKLELNNISKYKPKSFSEYRSILLDGVQPKYLHFSMVPKGSRLSKLYSLFVGMLNRSADFDVLGKIISDWAHSDIPRDATEALEQFKLDKTQLVSWLKDYRSQHQFNKLMALVGFEKFEETFEQLQETTIFLLKTKAIVKARIITVKQQQIELSKEHTEKGENLKLEKEGINTEHERAKHQVSTEEDNFKVLTSEISTLEARNTSFKKILGEDYQTKLAQLENQSKEKEQLTTQLTSLTKQSGNIADTYKGLLLEVENSFTALINEYEQELSKANAACANNESRCIKSFSAKKEQITVNFQANDKELNTQLQNLISKSGRLENTIDNPIVDIQLRNLVSESQEKFDYLTGQRNVLQEKTNQVHDNYSQALNAYNTINFDMEKVGKELDEVMEELEDAQAALGAHEDSLLVYLQKEVPNWEHTFGKVFSLKALLNRNLVPQKVDNDLSSAFGVQLDINAIPNSEAFDIQTITQRVDVLVEIQEDLEKQLSVLDSNLLKANKDREETQKELDHHKQRLRQIQRDITQAESTLLRTRNELKKAQELLVDEARVSLVEIKEKLIPELEVAITGNENEFKTAIEKIANDEKSAIDKEVNLLKNTQQRIETVINEASINKEKRVLELHSEREQQLTTAGIDTELVQELESKIIVLNTSIDTLTALKATSKAFETFKNTEYINIKKLKSELSLSENSLVSLKHKKSRLLISLTSKDDEITALDKEFDQQIKNIEADIGTYEYINSDINHYYFERSYNEPLEDDQRLTARNIKRQYEEYRDTFNTTKQHLSQQIYNFRDFFNRDLVKGTLVYSYWNTHSHSEERILETAKILINYVKQGHQDNDIRSLKNNLNQLDKLNSFVGYISQFSNKMRYFNKRLDEHMSQVTEFDSLKSLTANLQFNLANESCFKDMKNLSDKYAEYKDAERGAFSLGDIAKAELPPESLFASIEDFIENTTFDLNIKDLAKYIDFRITFNDKGQTRDIRTAKLLKDATSNALSYLVLVVLFVGFVNMVRQSNSIKLTWAVDELLDIHTGNISKLLELLSSNNINMISACPSVDEQVFELFNMTYEIFEEDDGLVVLRDYGNVNQSVDEVLANIIGSNDEKEAL